MKSGALRESNACRCDLDRMNQPATSIFCTIAIAGCGASFDPCSQSSPLWNGLTDDQKANCSACGDPNTSDCQGTETGQGESQSATCGTNNILCYIGDVRDYVGDPFGVQFNVVDVDDTCDGVIRSFSCGRSWFDEDSTGLECMTCNLLNYLGAPLNTINSSSPPICKTNVLNGYASWEPATDVPHPSYELPSDWVNSLGCTDPQQQPFVCPDGLVGIKPEFDFNLSLTDWTCRCPSGDDSACQPGAVCEAGYVFENGLPRPTLCTWDDGSGTPNGPAPEGPVVYGLHNWVDGFDVTITGTDRASDVTVIVAPQALVGAISNAGLWNDDQRFTVADDGLSASIDHCGPDALCSVIGLAMGDVVYLDSLETYGAYLEATATVRHADGRVSSITAMTE